MVEFTREKNRNTVGNNRNSFHLRFHNTRESVTHFHIYFGEMSVVVMSHWPRNHPQLYMSKHKYDVSGRDDEQKDDSL